MKENEIPFLSTIIMLSGVIVLTYLVVLMFLIKVNLIDKNFDTTGTYGYTLTTIVLIGTGLLFYDKRKQAEIIKEYSSKPNIKFYNYIVWAYTVAIGLLCITIPYWR